MKRIATAAAAFLLTYSSFGIAQAATLRPIDQDGLNLRAGPGTDYAIVGVLPPDQQAAVVGREGDWYKVRLSSGPEGWVAGWYSKVSYADEERYALVNTDILNLRQVPALGATVVAKLAQGQRVRLLETNPEWWRVRLDDGTEGWVAATYMTLAPTTAPGTAPITPPTTPPVAPPVTPPAPPVIPSPSPTAPPPAPAGTVPQLAVPAPSILTPLPGKSVAVNTETGVYAGPNNEARRVDTARPGESLRLLDAAGGWVRAETPRGMVGWIPGSLVQVHDGRLVHTFADRAWALEAMTSAPASTTTPPATDATVDLSHRYVSDPDGLHLRLIPSIQAQSLGVLPQGELLEVLSQDGRWLKVQTSGGLVGWVMGDYTLPVGGQSAPAPSPAPVITGKDFKVSMGQPFAGAVRLTVEAGGTLLGTPVLEGSVLRIPFPTGELEDRSIPLNMMGVRRAIVDPTGLRLELSGHPWWQVEEQTNRISILLRPSLNGITRETVDGKEVLRFAIGGETQPSAREAGANIIIEVPGAVLGAPITLDGLKVVQHETGVRIAVPSYRSFAMKRSEQGYYMVIYPPGLAGKAILLDPGHGGDDSGAVSWLTGVVEKEINLQVALRVRALLEAKGARVFMTRASDQRVAPESYLDSSPMEPRDQLDMQYRTLMANHLKVDLFLSVHHNSGDPGDRGTETFYTSTTLNGERSLNLARLVQAELVPAIGTINRGAKDDTYFVTRNTDAPAALLEVAFIHDPAEGPRTRDAAFQETVAQAVVRALEKLYAERPR